MTPSAVQDEDFSRVTGRHARFLVTALLGLLVADTVSVIVMLFWL